MPLALDVAEWSTGWFSLAAVVGSQRLSGLAGPRGTPARWRACAPRHSRRAADRTMTTTQRGPHQGEDQPAAAIPKDEGSQVRSQAIRLLADVSRRPHPVAERLAVWLSLAGTACSPRPLDNDRGATNGCHTQERSGTLPRSVANLKSAFVATRGQRRPLGAGNVALELPRHRH